jgi:hypothetical protein
MKIADEQVRKRDLTIMRLYYAMCVKNARRIRKDLDTQHLGPLHKLRQV